MSVCFCCGLDVAGFAAQDRDKATRSKNRRTKIVQKQREPSPQKGLSDAERLRRSHFPNPIHQIPFGDGARVAWPTSEYFRIEFCGKKAAANF
jgi:hypothetical protein